jgi:uncharacterized RDD family membrane protein YckC
MTELNSYSAKLKDCSNFELSEIKDGLDQEKYPDRYAAVVNEIQNRKEDLGFEFEKLPKSNTNITIQLYNTIQKRIRAQAIDGLIFFIPSYIGLSLSNAFSDHDLRLALNYSVFTAYEIYVIVMTWKFGGTIGKLASGIKVVSSQTSMNPSLWQSIKRSTFFLIETSTYLASYIIYGNQHTLTPIHRLGQAFLIADLAFGLFDKKHRALHDYIGETVCTISNRGLA